MPARCFELPDEVADWPPWLDRQLVSDELGQLAAEFAIAGESRPEEPPSLDALIGDNRQPMLQRGTEALSETQLRNLIRYPSRLLDLQELVLTEGDDHWIRLSRQAPHADRATALWSNIQHTLNASQGSQQVAPDSPHPADGERSADDDDARVSVQNKEDGTKHNSSLWGPLLAIAVAVLLAVGGWLGFRQQGPGWGFDNQELLAADVQPDQYFEMLADAAGGWFNKRPVDNESLAKRLGQFSEGCEILLAAKHPQISTADREWLLGKCEAWKANIDQLREQVIAGEKDFSVALAESDQIINKLEKALRERGEVATAIS